VRKITKFKLRHYRTFSQFYRLLARAQEASLISQVFVESSWLCFDWLPHSGYLGYSSFQYGDTDGETN